jgi:hypothetical protein
VEEDRWDERRSGAADGAEVGSRAHRPQSRRVRERRAKWFPHRRSENLVADPAFILLEESEALENLSTHTLAQTLLDGWL